MKAGMKFLGLNPHHLGFRAETTKLRITSGIWYGCSDRQELFERVRAKVLTLFLKELAKEKYDLQMIEDLLHFREIRYEFRLKSRKVL